MLLHDLKPPRWSKKRKKIVGRGPGSGHGKTSCKGHKGQTSRSGRGILRSSEGGQMPLIKRIAKVGFRSKIKKDFQLVNLKNLMRFKEGSLINAEFLKSHGLIKNADKPFKILGDGDIQKPLEIHAHQFSGSAKEKIVKAGGKAELIKN